MILWSVFSRAEADSSEVREERMAKVAASKAWQRLLHYQARWYGGGTRSLMDGEGFFFAPNGRKDALAELKASIAAMGRADLQLGQYKQHPQCAFPERYRFLRENFPGELPPPVDCPLFNDFVARFNDPQGLSLIFSSAFPNNPASMFGHTFLRIKSARNTDLLDYGINFAAMVSESEPAHLFVVLGVFGGYRGQWSSMPYYVKVQDYINAESRDLWEYELDFTPEETRRLIGHLWEMETNSFFAYYFFDENCSYQILAALEAIKPEWDLLHFTLGLLPGESVKSVAFTPGAVRNVKFRPSLHNQFFNTYRSLNSGEKTQFHNLISRREPLASFTSRPVLDAGIVYLDYLSNEHKSLYKDKYEAFRKEVLSHRATLGPATQAEVDRVPPLKGETRPDLGHDAYNFRLGAGYRDAGAAEGYSYLQLHFPYHDLLNNDLGYTRYAHMEFPWIELQSSWRKPGVRVERLTLLSSTSLMVFSKLDLRPSWKVESGFYTARDYGCQDCGHWFTELGGGTSMALGHPRNRWYAMGLIRPEFSPDLNKGYRFLPGIESGLLLNPAAFYKTRLNVTQYWNLGPKQDNSQLLNLRWEHAFYPARNWEIRQSNILGFADAHPRPHAEHRLESVFFFK